LYRMLTQMKYMLLNLYNMSLCYLNYNEGGATRECLLLLEEISASYFSIKNQLVERLLHFSTQFNVKHADFPAMRSEFIHILTATAEKFGIRVPDTGAFTKTQDLRYPGLGYIPKKKVYLIDRMNAELEARKAQNNKIESRRFTPILTESKPKLKISERPKATNASATNNLTYISEEAHVSTQMNDRTDLDGILSKLSYQRGKTAINESLLDKWYSPDASNTGSPNKAHPSNILDDEMASPRLPRSNTSRVKFGSGGKAFETSMFHLPTSVMSKTQAKLKKVVTANSVYSITKNRNVSKESLKDSPSKSKEDASGFTLRHNLLRTNASTISESNSSSSKLHAKKSPNSSKVSEKAVNKKFHIKANISNQLKLDMEMNSLVLSSRMYRTTKENMRDSER
jgi:hypothetical protein